jgi:hypothetical protein
MKNTLELGLIKTLEKGINRSSDKFIRIELSSAYPLEIALVEIQNRIPNLLIGLLEPFKPSFFSNSKLNLESDPSKLTMVRNDRSENANPVILIGVAFGPQESGLRDLGTVITEHDVIQEWKASINSKFLDFEQNKEVEIRKTLSSLILNKIENGEANPNSANQLIEVLIDPNKTLYEFQQNLFLIDLLPDDQLIGSSNLKVRFNLNSNLVSKAQSQEDIEIYEKLKNSRKKEIVYFKNWLKSKDINDLANSSLPKVLELLGEADTSGGKTGGTGQPALKHLLNVLASSEYSESVDFKREIVIAIKEAFDEKYWLYGEVSHEVMIDDKRVGLGINSIENDNLRSWTRSIGASEVSEIINIDELDRIPVFLYGENTPDAEIKAFSSNSLENWAISVNLVNEVDLFLKARRNLLQSYRLLSTRDEDLLLLLFLSSELSTLVESYLNSWQNLLEAASMHTQNDDIVLLQFLEGIWKRQIEKNETSDQSSFVPKAKYEKVTLSAWHPWRLKPILELSKEIYEDPWDHQVVSSALWALSRAVPLYRVWAATVDRDNLQFKTSVYGNCEFNLVNTEAIQPLSGGSGSINRSIKSYFDTHEWSKLGSSVLIVNPPIGGSIKKISEDISNLTIGKDSISTTVIRTRNLSGQEPSDDFNGLVSFHDSIDLDSDISKVSGKFELSLLFLPAMNATINSIQTGAHGRIDVSLKPKAVSPDGSQLYEPQITVSPDSENDFINLLFKVAGQESAHVANYPLVIPEDSRKIIEKVVKISEWTIVAIPGAVGVPDVFLDSKKMERASVVAQFDDQQYRCFTYSRSLLPLVWKIKDYLNLNIPISTSTDKQKVIIDSLSNLALNQHTKMFELSNNRFGVNEIFGLLVAREFSNKLIRPGSLVLEISLDDTDWTNSWLDSTNQRADLILVDISSDPEDEIPVKLIVLEAKARSDSFGKPSLDVDPFSDAVHQVSSTIDKLRHLMLGRRDSLSQSIRLRAFTEQVAAVASSEYLRAKNKADFNNYFKNLSKFISDPSSSLERIEGLIVGLFTGGHELAVAKRIQTGVNMTLVSASAKTLEDIFLNVPLELNLGELMIDDVSKIESNDNEAFDTNLNVDSDSIDKNKSIQSPEKEKPPIQIVIDNPNNFVSNSVTGSSPAAVDLENDFSKKEKISNLLQNLVLYSKDINKSEEMFLVEGPTFNAFSIALFPGASLSAIQRSSQDIARELGVSSVEISNDESHAGYVRILVPRLDRNFPAPPIGIPKCGSDEYLPIYVGQKLNGEDHVSSLNTWPHALIAGTTGSGKTSFLRGLITQVSNNEEFRSQLIVVDGKGESDYFGIAPTSAFHPKYPKPELTMAATTEILNWLVNEEIPRRRSIINQMAEKRNSRIDAKEEYINSNLENSDAMFSPIVVIVDEFAELMLERGHATQEFIDNVSSVCQTGRSALVHLILATQRPDRKIVPGRIHANLDTKVALRVPTPADSMTILGYGGAEKLLGAGDMLFSWKGSENLRLQGYYFK